MQTEWSPGTDDTADTPAPAPWSSAPSGRVAGGGVEADDAIRGEDEPATGEEAVAEEEQHRTAVDAVDRLLDEVELALARLDDGTYGRCEACGEPIADDRLTEHPIVRTCDRCDEVDGGPAAAGPTEPVTT